MVLSTRRRLFFSSPKRLLIAALIVIATVFLIDRFVSPSHLPWKPLDMDAGIGLATGTKITMLALAPGDKCFDKLATAKTLSFDMAEPSKSGETCGWEKAAKLDGTNDIAFRPANVAMQCPVAAAGYIWLLDLDKKAKARFGSGLNRVFHAGTYSCRRMVGNSSGAWSEHAYANAWDVTGFELKDGTIISVWEDWRKADSDDAVRKAAFLKDARGTACKLFRVVLSPDYNAAHKDHFHLDQGPSLSCR